jgi:site-specific DNA-methyltransferase (adenine-specific)
MIIDGELFLENQVRAYCLGSRTDPLWICGDCEAILAVFPSDCIDCAITSPPYWGKREYDNGGMGLEAQPEDYIRNLQRVFSQLKRVLKSSGSFWLNIGDTYVNKSLAGIPWRLAITMMDEDGWTLRNSVIWHKVKGGLDNTKDRLRNVHEDMFHFVKDEHKYYYDVDRIRSRPAKAKVVNGAIVSATGVRGVRYKRQIELSTALSDDEKRAAFEALDEMLGKIGKAELADFRMIIRGQQRTTHSDSQHVSGRARELRERGFYFLRYHPNGSKPGDLWDIIPEDTQNRIGHFAPFPVDLCRIPILATCPDGGVVLDPFCGTGTAMLTAKLLGRKSIGIDISRRYLRLAEGRMKATE